MKPTVVSARRFVVGPDILSEIGFYAEAMMEINFLARTRGQR